MQKCVKEVKVHYGTQSALLLHQVINVLTHFWSMSQFYGPLKTLENQCLQGALNETTGQNWIKRWLLTL